MPLTAAGPYALGRNKIWFTEKETTCGTPVVPTDANKMCVLSSSFDFSQARTDRTDCKFTTRSMTERITGRRTVSWNMEMFLLATPDIGPDPDEANPPQMEELIECCMGKVGVDSGAEVLYALEGSQEAVQTLTIYEHLNDVLSQQAVGAWVEEMTISISGGEDARISFSGGAFDLTQTGRAALLGAEASSQTVLTLKEIGDVFNFEGRTLNGGSVEIGSLVSLVNSIGKDNVDNGVGPNFEGYRVTDVNTDTNEITVAPPLVIGAAADDLVMPYLPGNSTASRDIVPPAGEVIPGILGSFVLGDAVVNTNPLTFPVTAFTVTLTNNFKAFEDTVFEEAVSDFVPGMRNVEGEFTLRGRRDHIKELIKRKSFLPRYLTATLGSQAGRTLRLDMPKIEMLFSAVTVPEDEEVLIPIPFKALATDETSDDELTLTFK